MSEDKMEPKENAARLAPCAISYRAVYRDERSERSGRKGQAGLRETCIRVFRLGSEAAGDPGAKTRLFRGQDGTTVWNADGIWNEPDGLPGAVKRNPALPVLLALREMAGVVVDDMTGMLRYLQQFDRQTVRKVTDRAMRGDTVLAYDIVLRPDPRTLYERTAGWTPEDWAARQPAERGRFLWDRWQKFASFAVEAAKRRWGACTAAIALHYDGAPHVHILAVPVEDGILNSARALGLCMDMTEIPGESHFCRMFKDAGYAPVMADEPFPGAAGPAEQPAEADAPAPFPAFEGTSPLASCAPAPADESSADACTEPAGTEEEPEPEAAAEAVAGGLEQAFEPAEAAAPEPAPEPESAPAPEPASEICASAPEDAAPVQIAVSGSDPDELDMAAALDGRLLALLEQEMPIPGLESGAFGVLDVPDGARGISFGMALAACAASGTRLWSLPSGARPAAVPACFVLCGPGARTDCIVTAGRTGSAMTGEARAAAASRLACIPKEAVPGWDELPRMLASWARGRSLLVAGGIGGIPGIGRMLAEAAAASGCAILLLRRSGEPEPEDFAWRGSLAAGTGRAWRLAAAGSGLFRFESRILCRAEGVWEPAA